MTDFEFVDATREQAKLRMAIAGPSGAGKSWTALGIATHLSPGGKVFVVDAEKGSVRKYAKTAKSPGYNFKVLEITPPFHPDRFVAAIKAAEKAGAEVIVLDGCSTEWNGPGGCLDLITEEETKAKSTGGRGNNFGAYKIVTPIHNRFIHAILGSSAHVICTFRAKQDYVLENNKPKKVGMAPEARPDTEFEFDVFAMVDIDHNMHVQKSRCVAISDKLYRPSVPATDAGKDIAETLRDWLGDGSAAVARVELTWEQRFSKARDIVVGCGSVDELKAASPELGKLLPKAEAPAEMRAELSKLISEAQAFFATPAAVAS
jgi:hypothetical protein